jgi:hypothetical protein
MQLRVLGTTALWHRLMPNWRFCSDMIALLAVPAPANLSAYEAQCLVVEADS